MLLPGTGRIEWMPSLTAGAAFALLGYALLTWETKPERLAWWILPMLGAGAIAAARLLFVLFDVDVGPSDAAWMAPHAAGLLLLISIAFVLLARGSPRCVYTGQILALVCALASTVSLLGYAFGAIRLYQLSPTQVIPVPGAVALVLFAAALLLARPDSGPVEILVRSDPGGALVRLVLPLLGVPLAVGWIVHWGRERGLYDQVFEEALLAVAVSVVLGLALWHLAQRVSRETALRASDDRALAANQETLRLLAQSVPDYAMFMLSPEGRVVTWNPGAERVLGYAAEEILGERYETFFHREDIEQGEPQALLDRARESGHAVAEGWRRRKNGTQFRAHVTLTALHDELGRLRGFAKVTRDMDVLLKTQEQEVRLRSLVETATDAILVIDERGAIESFNPAAERIFGYSHREMTGADVSMLMPSPYRGEHDNVLTRYLATGDARLIGSGREVVAQRKDGTCIPMELAASDMWLGGHHKFTCFLRDITERKQMERAQRESEERFRATFEQAAVGIAHLDVAGNWLRVNDKLCELLGYPREVLTGGGNLTDVAHRGDYAAVRATLRRIAVNHEDSARLEARYLHPDGQVRWVDFTLSGARASGADPAYLIAVIEDITARKDNEQQLKEAQAQLQLAAQIAELGFWEWDVRSNAVYFSPEYKRQLGYRDEEMTNRFDEWESRLHPDDRERVLEMVSRYVASPWPDYQTEFRIRHRDGSYRWVAARALVFLEAGHVARMVGTHLDITERKELEERIRRMAQHDPLTGLPGRALIREFAEHLLARVGRSETEAAFLFVDLDRFKPINDVHGHDVGDAVLQDVGRRLRQSVREEDLVGRVGGDEFLVILVTRHGARDVARAARQIIAEISSPYHVAGLELKLSPSIGIAMYPQDGLDLDQLIKAADVAMYHAKDCGRSTFQFYTEELNQRAGEMLAIENGLKTGLQRGEFELHYQALVDTASDAVTGVEAFLRWRPAGRAGVGPDKFIPVAETTGLIRPLGQWALEEACRQHQEWRRAGLPAMRVAVKVSALQFRQHDMRRSVERAMEKTGIAPEWLQLEVTESTILKNLDEAVDVLRELKSLGLRLSLGHFGTGFSSLGYLSRLPFDQIKVDKSLVCTLNKDKASQAVAEAVFALARTLRLEVVAEGIESAETLALLKERACAQAQGFMLCHPMPGAEFADWYRGRLAA